MISNLVNGEADVMTTSLTLCCGRTNAVDYLWSLSFSTAGLLIKGKVNFCPKCSIIKILKPKRTTFEPYIQIILSCLHYIKGLRPQIERLKKDPNM